MKQQKMKSTACPLCEHENFIPKVFTKDFSLTQEDFTIVECASCGLLFTNPRPSNDDIGAYYKSANYISHTNQKRGVFGFIYQFLRNRALTAKRGWINKYIKSGRLLDYGSGTGEFLNHMQHHGWEVRGFEIAEGPRNRAREMYNLDVLEPQELAKEPKKTYDVITMWHVLEHLDNLVGAAKEIVTTLKPGGLLVLALPNPESWDAKYYKEYWAAWDVPIHFYHFKKKDINLLASKLGLQIVEIINMPYDSYYVSLLSEHYKAGKKNWLKAFLIGLLSNIKAGNKNASSLTYILRKL